MRLRCDSSAVRRRADRGRHPDDVCPSWDPWLIAASRHPGVLDSSAAVLRQGAGSAVAVVPLRLGVGGYLQQLLGVSQRCELSVQVRGGYRCELVRADEGPVWRPAVEGVGCVQGKDDVVSEVGTDAGGGLAAVVGSDACNDEPVQFLVVQPPI